MMTVSVCVSACLQPEFCCLFVTDLHLLPCSDLGGAETRHSFNRPSSKPIGHFFKFCWKVLAICGPWKLHVVRNLPHARRHGPEQADCNLQRQEFLPTDTIRKREVRCNEHFSVSQQQPFNTFLLCVVFFLCQTKLFFPFQVHGSLGSGKRSDGYWSAYEHADKRQTKGAPQQNAEMPSFAKGNLQDSPDVRAFGLGEVPLHRRNEPLFR